MVRRELTNDRAGDVAGASVSFDHERRGGTPLLGFLGTLLVTGRCPVNLGSSARRQPRVGPGLRELSLSLSFSLTLSLSLSLSLSDPQTNNDKRPGRLSGSANILNQYNLQANRAIMVNRVARSDSALR